MKVVGTVSLPCTALVAEIMYYMQPPALNRYINSPDHTNDILFIDLFLLSIVQPGVNS